MSSKKETQTQETEYEQAEYDAEPPCVTETSILQRGQEGVKAKGPNFRNHLSLTEKVYVALKKMIIDLHFPPGKRLTDSELAKQFGVSNTPVREALRRLAADALVESIPRRGTIVRWFTAEDYRKLSEIREALEVLAGRLTAERASDPILREIADVAACHMKAVESGSRQKYLALDRQFHTLLAKGSDNEILVSMLNSIADRIQIARNLDKSRKRDLTSGQQHRAIAAELVRRDAEKAAQLIKRHIRENSDRVISLLQHSENESIRHNSRTSQENSTAR